MKPDTLQKFEVKLCFFLIISPGLIAAITKQTGKIMNAHTQAHENIDIPILSRSPFVFHFL